LCEQRKKGVSFRYFLCTSKENDKLNFFINFLRIKKAEK
jgi:hypothetical protein